MNIFLDTNVVVDYLACRKDFYDDAAIIFELINRNLVKAFVSSLTIINCAYVMRKFFPKEIVLQKIEGILHNIHITSIDEDCILKAIKKLPYDFEDAVQYESSQTAAPSIIISRDQKGFRDLNAIFMTPKEFISHCREA